MAEKEICGILFGEREASQPKGGPCAAYGGRGGSVEAMREAGRCSPERPGLGSKVARTDIVPIGEEVAVLRAIGTGGDPASAVAMAVNRATEVEFPFAPVDLVVGIMVDLE